MNFKSSKSYTVDEIKLLLERFCIYQDRCHQEVEKKIISYTVVTEVKELVLLHLLEHDYLNEERFAKSFVRGKFNQKHWGRNKIKQQLKFKNISDYSIKIGFKEIDFDIYLEVLKKELIKKENLVKETNLFLKKKKVVTYLMNKGFEYNLIIELYKEFF